MFFFWYIQCRKMVVTLKSGSEVTESGINWYRPIVYSCLLVFFSNFIPKTHRFGDIRLVIIPWSWNPGWGSLKVIENFTIPSSVHDFLLTFHSNHRPVSHCLRGKRRFQSRIAKFSHFRVFNAPAEGVPLGIGYRRKGSKKLKWRGYRWTKKF